MAKTKDYYQFEIRQEYDLYVPSDRKRAFLDELQEIAHTPRLSVHKAVALFDPPKLNEIAKRHGGYCKEIEDLRKVVTERYAAYGIDEEEDE